MRELDDLAEKPKSNDKPSGKLDVLVTAMVLIETVAVAVPVLLIGAVLTKIGLLQRGQVLDWYESALKVVDFPFRVASTVVQTIFWVSAAIARLLRLAVVWQWVWARSLRLWLKKPWQKMMPQRKAI